MTETSITASLPTITMEISRREAAHGPVVTVRLWAAPSLGAARGMLGPMAGVPMVMMAGPVGFWMRTMAAVWEPWLAASRNPMLRR